MAVVAQHECLKEEDIKEIRQDVNAVLRILNGNGVPGMVAHVHNHGTDIGLLKDNIKEMKQVCDRRQSNRAVKRFGILSDLDWYRWVILIIIASHFLGVKPSVLLDMATKFMMVG